MSIAHQIVPNGIASKALAARNGNGLSALVQRAASQLASATTAAEVLDARDLASVAYDAAKKAARLHRAKGAHDELVAKAHRAQADALLIESEAKRRLADEYDAAQERGELGKRGDYGAVTSATEVTPATAADIGLTHKDIHEARQVRDAEVADPGIVERTVNDALAKGEEPTKAKLRKAVEQANGNEGDMDAVETDVKLPTGPRLSIPEGQTPEQVCRRGMALEADGISTADVAKEIGVGVQSYRNMSDIVLLSDRDDLSPRDKETVARARRQMNETHRVADAWLLIERIAGLFWGKGLGKSRDIAEANRNEQFERSFGILIQTCLTTEEVELPYLTAERAAEAIRQLSAARSALLRFADRIKEIHG